MRNVAFALVALVPVAGCENEPSSGSYALAHSAVAGQRAEDAERTTEDAENEVVRYCDDEQLADVLAFAPMLGPTCSKTPTELATALFEHGVTLGAYSGIALVRTRATLDAVQAFPVDHDTGVAMVSAEHAEVERADEEQKSRIRKAIVKLSEKECLVAAVALRILRGGAACGASALSTSDFKDAYRKAYLKVCSSYAAEEDCAARADAGCQRFAVEYRSNVEHGLHNLGD
jgi:hypothetical protein